MKNVAEIVEGFSLCDPALVVESSTLSVFYWRIPFTKRHIYHLLRQDIDN